MITYVMVIAEMIALSDFNSGYHPDLVRITYVMLNCVIHNKMRLSMAFSAVTIVIIYLCDDKGVNSHS